MSNHDSSRVAVEELAFPLLAFDKYSFGIIRDPADLTVTWTSLIKSGWFDGLQIIDSRERGFQVTNMTVKGGVGPLWGWSRPMAGRRVRVELSIRRAADVTLDAIKQKLQGLLRGWHGWQSRGDYDELEAMVRDATSLRQLLEGLRQLKV